MSATMVSQGLGLDRLLEQQKAAFLRNPYPSAKQRKEHLSALLDLLIRNQDRLAQAVDEDFGGRPVPETKWAEVFTSAQSLRYARQRVSEWMQKSYREVGLALKPAQAYVMPQPLGVVGIISPWNYPVFLAFGPLAGAIAAGNRVMLKPSELTPRTSDVLAEIIASRFPADHISVVTGDAEVGKAFSSLPFDHLLFTGSTQVGRHVMRAAADNLTPVTLELGGKSPVIIAEDANLKRAADDIAYGKWLNAGQTCIAPDYLLVPTSIHDRFVELLTAAARARFSEQYTSIINQRHYDRLQGYIDEARARGVRTQELVSVSGTRKLAPTLLFDPPSDLRVMQEEIFGPVLPVKRVADLQEAISFVNSRPRPLALYLFSKNSKTKEHVLTHTVAGGVVINDTLLHCACDDLPFGGVGESGMGAYHGREGFETFSRMKPVFARTLPGLGGSTRPPYGKQQEHLQKLMIR
jgi:coniferyl-aldehyde dehydrogenase